MNPHVDQDRLLRLVPVQAEEARQIMPTLFEQKLEQGRQEGQREMLLRQLMIRFGELPTEVIEHVRNAPGERLLTWSERFVTARTLEEVFAGKAGR